LVRRFLVQKKAKKLSLETDKTKRTELLTKFGVKHQVVTESTSFIILSSLEEYLKHSVVPPESLPKIRSEYLALKGQETSTADSILEKKMSYLLTLWGNLQKQKNQFCSGLFLGFIINSDDVYNPVISWKHVLDEQKNKI